MEQAGGVGIADISDRMPSAVQLTVRAAIFEHITSRPIGTNRIL